MSSESVVVFNAESTKLEMTINTTLNKSELSIPEIIQIYYDIINVNSLCVILQQQFELSDKNHSIFEKIKNTQKLILEKFDLNLHRSIIVQLENSLVEITQKLQSTNNLEKSNDDVEIEAKLFEKLRQIMSTKEFVEQYDQGLSHD
jgi:hypothetical protein